MSHTRNLGCTCAHRFQKRTWGVLIGAGALNRTNTVASLLQLMHLNISFPQEAWGLSIDGKRMH